MYRGGRCSDPTGGILNNTPNRLQIEWIFFCTVAIAMRLFVIIPSQIVLLLLLLLLVFPFHS